MISIIIPVYNEEKTIKLLLDSLSYNHKFEIIVVDGSSTDETLKIASAYSVKIIKSIKNRARQLNEGARLAKGDKFLFLHADCRLEQGSLEDIECALNNGFIGGCLSQKIESGKIIYRFIEGSGNIRARLSRVFYGDQGIFVRRDAFFKIGGFDDVELFDDLIFSKNLKQIGKTCQLKKRIYSSARRWERQGIVKATLINWLLSLGFLLGLPPDRLSRIYKDIR
jgi:rSAM/selenodomain-associated transferase 2